MIFDFSRLRIFPITFPLSCDNGGAAERCQLYPPSDPHLVLLVHAWCSYDAGSRRLSVDAWPCVCLLLLLLSGPSPSTSTPRCQCQRQPQCQPPLVTATKAAGNTRLHEKSGRVCPRALPDLCGPHTDRDSAALRSTERDILGNDTRSTSFLLAVVCARLSIKSSYRALNPGLSTGLKLPIGHTPFGTWPPTRTSIPPPSEGFPSVTCSVSPRVSSASEPSRSGQTCTSPSSPPCCVPCCGFTRGTQPGLGLLENSGFENVPHKLDELERPEGQTSAAAWNVLAGLHHTRRLG